MLNGFLPLKSPVQNPIFLFKFFTKLMLGGVLLSFFINYQPSLGIPPIKKNQVLAQTEQVATVSAQISPVVFQIPHPGYLSTHYSSYHPGIDLAAGLGAPIKAISGGTVIDTGYNFWGLGLTVTVNHGYGYKSLYAHLGKTYVKKDQIIASNDYIGEVGLTGNTSGPHTHMEVYKDGSSIDPLVVIPTIRDYPLAEDFKPVGGAKSIIPKHINITPNTQKPKAEVSVVPSQAAKTENLNLTLTNILGKDIQKEQTEINPIKDLKLGL